MPTRILLQTTIEPAVDNWSIARFSLLRAHLEGLSGKDGAALYAVTARDRGAPPGSSDPVLVSLDQSDFDELWLSAVDPGDGLEPKNARRSDDSGIVAAACWWRGTIWISGRPSAG